MNWSRLRHRMLQAVRDGKVGCSGGPWWFKRQLSTQPQMARAMNTLRSGGYVRLLAEGQVELTHEGELLLTWWSEHYAVA
jgi:hypothetical protein